MAGFEQMLYSGDI